MVSKNRTEISKEMAYRVISRALINYPRCILQTGITTAQAAISRARLPKLELPTTIMSQSLRRCAEWLDDDHYYCMYKLRLGE